MSKSKLSEAMSVVDNTNIDKPEKQPVRIPLKEGLKFTITAAITNASVFNHYILKEYAPRVQGNLALSKSPAKHTLENCVYDEIAGWLDSPSVTGLAILNVEAEASAFKNTILNPDPKVSFSDIVDLLYNVCQLGTQGNVIPDSCNVDEEHLQNIRTKAKLILQHLDKVVPHEANKEPTAKVGSGLRKGAVSRELPKTS